MNGEVLYLRERIVLAPATGRLVVVPVDEVDHYLAGIRDVKSPTRQHLLAGAAFSNEGEGDVFAGDGPQDLIGLLHGARAHDGLEDDVRLSFLQWHAQQ
jgi:hypothetical protein